MRPRVSVRVREGSLLTLRCYVGGDPPPSLTWQKPGSSQSILKASDTSELIITSVGPEDEGTYVCVASSLAGQVEDWLQVSLADDDDISRGNTTESGLTDNFENNQLRVC